MTYKTLLVHLDDSSHCAARTEFACELARRYGAHLIGAYAVCQELTRPIFLHSEGGWVGSLEARRDQNLKNAYARFHAAAGQAGLNAEWRVPDGAVVESTVLHARHADLLILGQYDAEETASYVAPHFAEDVVMSSGRPAIVLPYVGPGRSFAQNVLIAWDGSRESARAVADAVPVIRHAKSVTVVTVEAAPAGAAPTGIDVAAWLERHGIHASFATAHDVAGVSTGELLLNVVSDQHSDLLVMGAYGHSRAQETLLGGVTRTLLKSMTVPVLMSH